MSITITESFRQNFFYNQKTVKKIKPSKPKRLKSLVMYVMRFY